MTTVLRKIFKDKDVAARKDEENRQAQLDQLIAKVEYIALCDHPEIFDEEGGAE